jgi:hypothetical protein
MNLDCAINLFADGGLTQQQAQSVLKSVEKEYNKQIVAGLRSFLFKNKDRYYVKDGALGWSWNVQVL